MDTETKTELLKASLSVAVPMWIARIRKWSTSKRIERAQVCGQVVAEKGDVIQFKGKKGETAEAFNRLAEGIACLAFQPGGVRTFDLHFEAKRRYPVKVGPKKKHKKRKKRRTR